MKSTLVSRDFAKTIEVDTCNFDDALTKVLYRHVNGFKKSLPFLSEV